MDNKFGLKDLVTLLLIVATLISVWMAMYQFDRQWTTVQRIEDRLAELERMPRAAPGPTATATDTLTELDQRTFARRLAPRSNPEYATGGWYIDAFANTVGKLTPLVPADAYRGAVEQYVLESLIIRDPATLDWAPWIAHQWQVSQDGLTYSFDLRDDVVFSDGEPLTSEDVVFSYEWIMNPDVNTTWIRSYFENIESVTAQGPHRVVFKLREPYFQGLSITGGLQVLPKHYYEQFTPDEFNAKTGLLVGSGPYKLEGDPLDWEPGTGQVVLIRNERYWGPRPTLDRLVWKEISEQAARLAAFRNGEIDRFGVPPDQYPTLANDDDLLQRGKLMSYRSVNSGFRYVGWNQQRDNKPTLFANRDVRLAMTLLANREELCEQLLSGQATVATGPFHPLSGQADPQLEPWPYDPQRAKELLDQAGYKDTDGDGVRETPDGQPFRFSLIYPAGNPSYEQMAFYLRDGYARAGIVLEPDPTEWNTMLQRIDDRDFDAITLGWGGSIESDPRQIFHSAAIADGGNNYVHYVNEELDQIIDRARVTIDDEQRRELWHKVHRLLHHDQPYTFLFNSTANVYIGKRVRNVETTKLGINDATEYFIPKPLQQWVK